MRARPRRHIVVGEHFATSVPAVYAAGDITPGPQLAQSPRSVRSVPAGIAPPTGTAILTAHEARERVGGHAVPRRYIFDLLATIDGYRCSIPTSFINASISSISIGRWRLSHSTPVAVTTNMSSMRM